MNRHFASDNWAGVHPQVLAAVNRAAEGHAPSYGEDPLTVSVTASIRKLLGGGQVFFVLNGTAANVLGGRQPVLVCVAHPVVYALAGKTRELMQLPPEQRPIEVPSSGILRNPDHYVGVGDALTAARLAEFFGRREKPAQVRIGTDTSFTDLRNSPAVLIGAFTNQWTMLTDDLRFV